ncbi:MAG TPA: O-antigen ligase family protein [Candidatus Acidoferrales bacterium]|nr:O-antigen ligase family protein [Candidatus Acidoferrales bacterium]
MKSENQIEVFAPGSRVLERRKGEALAAEGAGSPNLVAYGIVLRKRRWTIMTLAAFLFTAVLIFTLRETPLYDAKALLEIEKENPNIVTAADLFEIDNVTNTYLETQYKVLESDSIARRVIHDLALDERPEFNPPRHWWSLAPPRELAARAAAVAGTPQPDSNGVFHALKTYQDRLDVEPVKQSRLVEVTFESRDPVLAAEIVNSISENYINHNHFSGLLEMILPLSLMLSLYYAQKSRRHPRPRSRGEFLSGLGRPDLLKCLLLLLASIVIFLGIVFSFSRMGLISAIASLALLALIVWSSRRRNPQPAWFILLLLFCGVAGTAWLGAGPVVRHFQALSRDDPIERGSEGRRALWADTVQLIWSRPWTGSGLGCFEIAFTRFQSVELDYTLDHAHNDYLEFAAELGIPAATLLFAMLFWIAARSLQAGLLARSSLSRAHALGVLGGASALLVHSLADFNLQIPANALVFCSLLGVGYAVALEARAEKQVASQARHIEAALPLATRPSEGSAQPRTAEEVEAPLKMSFNAPRSG